MTEAVLNIPRPEAVVGNRVQTGPTLGERITSLKNNITDFVSDCITTNPNEGAIFGLAAGLVAGVILLESLTQFGYISKPDSKPVVISAPSYNPKVEVVASVNQSK